MLKPRSFQLTPAQQALLLSEYEQATSVVEAMVRLKFNFWQQLPWKICGISHWDQQVSRACARQCTEQYDRAGPEIAADVHHRLSCFFLDPRGPIRAALDAYINGAELHGEPLLEIMTMRFVPTVERVVEQEHLPLNKVARHKRTFRGSAFSCATRTPGLLSELQKDQDFF